MTTLTRAEPLLVRPRRAAEMLGISVAQLNRLVRRGLIEPVRLVPNANRHFRVTNVVPHARQ